ncbi:unnamed protein product, partial [Nezara viridula]
MVSWVRHRDIHLLTVGRYTYTSDQRFRAIHHQSTEDWSLQIKYPQHRDSGIYECQISTTPHMSHFIHLNVVGEYFMNIKALTEIDKLFHLLGPVLMQRIGLALLSSASLKVVFQRRAIASRGVVL